MTADDPDPLERAVARLTPDARAALRRSLLRALGQSPPPPEPPAGLVNTKIEVLEIASDRAALSVAVARAARDGEQAPLVRVDAGEDYAILSSPAHIWRLVDRVDELEVALGVLASAWTRATADTDRQEALLLRLQA